MDANRDDDAPASSTPFPAAPTPSDTEYVEVERMEGDDDAARGRKSFVSGDGPQIRTFMFASQSGGLLKPPTVAAWICLLAAWFFLGSRIPFTIFIGLPVNLAALILAVLCLARGGLFTGFAVMALGTVGSFFVYLVGLFRFLAVS